MHKKLDFKIYHDSSKYKNRLTIKVDKHHTWKNLVEKIKKDNDFSLLTNGNLGKKYHDLK